MKILKDKYCTNGIECITEILKLFKELAVKKGLYLELETTFSTIDVNLDEKMKGEISLENEPGKGATFTVELPNNLPMIRGNEPLGIAEVDGNRVNIGNILFEKHGTMKNLDEILLVENDIPTIQITEHYLQHRYKIDSVIDGIGAVEAAKTKQYSVILMDINLGKGMNGLDAAKKIKAMTNYKEVPIIAYTAYAMKGDMEEFLASGCTHYLAKPFTKDQLIDMMNKALSKR